VNFNRLNQTIRGILVAVVAILITGCGGYDDGLTKHPVTGTVLIDGEPHEGVLVRFYREGTEPDSNADTPAGVTDESGHFALSTNGQNDGAVAGKYKATFKWPDFNGPGANDQLGSRYSDPAQSEFEVTISEGENELPTFKLKTPPSSAPASKRSKPPERDMDGRAQ